MEHDIGVECAILETKELVCGRLAVFISNRRRSPDIKYGCVGAADIFLEIITQPFLGFDGIVPGSSNQATV